VYVTNRLTTSALYSRNRPRRNTDRRRLRYCERVSIAVGEHFVSIGPAKIYPRNLFNVCPGAHRRFFALARPSLKWRPEEL
jgi:hypothetical protein